MSSGIILQSLVGLYFKQLKLTTANSVFVCFPQAELCGQSLVDIVQAVVAGVDGCVFCYGHARLGECLTVQ